MRSVFECSSQTAAAAIRRVRKHSDDLHIRLHCLARVGGDRMISALGSPGSTGRPAMNQASRAAPGRSEPWRRPRAAPGHYIAGYGALALIEATANRVAFARRRFGELQYPRLSGPKNHRDRKLIYPVSFERCRTAVTVAKISTTQKTPANAEKTKRLSIPNA
jgi:hypothetical protein